MPSLPFSERLKDTSLSTLLRPNTDLCQCSSLTLFSSTLQPARQSVFICLCVCFPTILTQSKWFSFGIFPKYFSPFAYSFPLTGHMSPTSFPFIVFPSFLLFQLQWNSCNSQNITDFFLETFTLVLVSAWNDIFMVCSFISLGFLFEYLILRNTFPDHVV